MYHKVYKPWVYSFKYLFNCFLYPNLTYPNIILIGRSYKYVYLYLYTYIYTHIYTYAHTQFYILWLSLPAHHKHTFAHSQLPAHHSPSHPHHFHASGLFHITYEIIDATSLNKWQFLPIRLHFLPNEPKAHSPSIHLSSGLYFHFLAILPSTPLPL